MLKIATALSVFSIILACKTEPQHLTIIGEGRSDYVIRVKDRQNPSLKFAANELQRYLEQSTGVRLPVTDETDPAGNDRVISIEVMPVASPVDTARILIENDGNNLKISGGSGQSTLYAVYEFLEKYADCHWLSPVAEVVPETRELRLALPVDHNYLPSVSTRTVHSSLYYEHPEYAAKMRVTTESFPGYVPEGRVHTFHRLVPEKDYFKSHPEYFALRNGRRIPAQLCLTHPRVFELIRDGVGDWFKKYPEAKIASVSQDDNQQFCQCADCMSINDREGTPAGSLIELVNKVATAFPDKTISTLAYQYSRKAPRNLKPAPNVLITLCSIECDRSGSIEDKCADFARDLEEWGGLTDNIRIWDYTTQFTNFLAPFPNLHTLQPNLALFQRNNTRWVFEQHSRQRSELFELRSWLLAKLLWNPAADTDSLIQVFCHNYYGAAAPMVENYVQTVHAELQNDSSFFLFLYGDPSQAFSSFLRPELLTRYNEWFDEAESAVQDDAVLLARVRSARTGVDLATLEACRRGLGPGYRLVSTGADGKPGLDDRVTGRLASFVSNCRSDSVRYMNENGFLLNDYETLYREVIRRAGSPNMAYQKKVTLNTKPKKYAGEDPQALTDGAYGGNSFYANWLGFEGNDLDAVIDLGENREVKRISTAFLQYVNHIVFLPASVTFYTSDDGNDYRKLGTVDNPRPLRPESRINFVQPFELEITPEKMRYVRVVADNLGQAPLWHHGAGMPCWIFLDEVSIE